MHKTQQIKLFLSVDIYGSTKLKNSNNYYRIQKFCQEYLETLKKIKVGQELNVEIKDVYASIAEKYEYQDWSQIISQCFSDFNIEFIKRRIDVGFFDEIFPWKMAGDELIYCITVSNRKEVYLQLKAFFLTLRFFDKSYEAKEDRIRLKGAAWTAGFPIRNRVMDSLGKLDYMGPEIDIGFRIGKFAFPGVIVCSLELVCILLDGRLALQSEKSKFRVIDTGWENLKGVWNGRKYPIYWLALPEDIEKDEDINYIPYKDWDLEENSHVKSYKTKLDERDFKTFDDISNLIKELPKKFDIEMPYFVGDKESPPEEHLHRLSFIQIVDEYQNNKTSQTKKLAASEEVQMDSKEIKDKIEDVLNLKLV